jgi:hypothetical protein
VISQKMFEEIGMGSGQSGVFQAVQVKLKVYANNEEFLMVSQMDLHV